MSEWIRVKDQLPDPYQDVICYSKLMSFDEIKIAHQYGKDEPYWTDDRGYGITSVTHWMPLPEKPVM